MILSLVIHTCKTSNNNKNNDHFHRSIDSNLENRASTASSGTDITNSEEKSSFYKGRILIVDDDPDITLSFGMGLEDGGFEVHTYNDSLDALANFKPNFYDLLLVDINMPKMNGFELCTKISEVDLNAKICFITAGDINIDGLREVYPALSTGCFIKKPISISELVKRLKAEIE
jgi:CheY-like chemotaxis protein